MPTAAQRKARDATGGLHGEYKPRPLQAEIEDDPARFKVACIHRRYGKTVLAVNWLIHGALENPFSFGYYVSPFKSQTKAVAWQYLKDYSPSSAVSDWGDLTIRFANGSIVALLGASDGWYQTHRGREAHRIVMDEVSQINPDAWRSVFRPMLSNTKGQALFIGTPQGEDFFHELFTNGDDEGTNKLPGWRSWLRDVYQTDVIDPEEIETLRHEMPDDDFEREFECRFDVPPRGAFYGKLVEQADTSRAIMEDWREVTHTSWYLDDTDQVAVIFWQVPSPDEFRIIDAYQKRTTSTEEIIEEIRGRGYTHKAARHYTTAAAKDAAGTRLDELRRAGFSVRCSRPMPVIDAIYQTKGIFPKLKIDSGLRDLVIALRSYHAEYDEQLKVFRRHPVIDWTHSYASAVSAFVTQYRPRSDWDRAFKVKRGDLLRA